ncbi:HNH endonuclease [Halobacillus litoralis]|uniref:HNH endonuclease n=1 Tax=Halobacillus litoralis TaxID=45668 RepID=UPI001CD570AE|nr:HNH endonuclease [Halobacillus litoralis]MCA1021469.1 HNH endonuclease [Halobacillus litoralis]
MLVRRKTHDEFIQEVNTCLGNDYEVVGRYVNARTKVPVKHICGYIWHVFPNRVKVNSCPKCSNVMRRTKEEFQELINSRFDGNYVLTSDFKGMESKVTILHLNCGNEMFMKATSFVNGDGCQRCNSTRILSHEEFIRSIENKFGNELRVKGKYKGRDVFIQFECVKHGLFHDKPSLVKNRKYPCSKCYQEDRFPLRRCSVCDSKHKVTRYKGGDLLCKKHRRQLDKYGRFKDRLTTDGNKIVVNQNYAEVYLYNNKGEVADIALIDVSDIDRVKKYNWHLNNSCYVHANTPEGKLSLHRLVTDCPEDEVVDHINRNTLDCRKSNLRICTQLENNKNASLRKDNTTGVRGVTQDNKYPNKPFLAYIQSNKKMYRLGRYETLEEAKSVRRKAEKEMYKEFAPDWGDTNR